MPAPTLRRRFLRLTVLNVLANLSVPLAGLVDTGMLGHLEDIRFLGGVALGTVIFDFVYWSFGFLRMGTTGLTAQAVGREDRRELCLVLYRALTLAGLLAGGLLLLQVPLRELGFGLLQGEAAVKDAGRAYFAARIWAAPATLANFALLGWFLGREESGRALAMTATANGLNVVLDYVFILRFGWGAGGAGAATALSQYGMLGVGAVLLLRSKPLATWSWRDVLERTELGALLALHRDILVRTACLVSTFAVFTSLSAALGTATLAANTILLKLFYLVSHGVDGAAFATESLAGILRGAGDAAGLRRLVRLATVVGLLFPIPVLAVLLVAPAPVYGLLTDHGDVIALATAHGWWLVPVLLLGAVAFVYDGLYLGLTAGSALRNAMLLSVAVGFLPLAFLAHRIGDNHLLWAAMAVFMGVRALTLEIPRRRVMRVG
ncbi:MAG: MATE family efflux transporter [Acidobacteriota bacterium]|jgi:MATE family multidrug resistance protein